MIRTHNEQLLDLVKIQERSPLKSQFPKSPMTIIDSYISAPIEEISLTDALTALNICNYDLYLEHEPQEAVMYIYKRFFWGQTPNWDTLGREWEEGTLDAKGIEDAIQESLFYQIVTHPRGRSYLSVEMYRQMIEEYRNSGRAPEDAPRLARILSTLTTMIGFNG
eukprot:TRINITY_DN10430_c0_g1_i1.p1 TRINITY_DN10430_c0_g1~~TRINITY_DN10430_c0_g1_i1.p1  ORF type:complete len:165 (+),score=51.53 TRINITY_DN10430_c0_g1_i1:90-584(+)